MRSPFFILSTGRTGTQFFEEYINRTSEKACCLHEPKPSRRFKFLSNMLLAGKASDERIVRAYLSARKRLSTKIGDRQYIESSNFMFGCIPALNHHFDNIGVIHIIRHPVTYVRSHLNHGFWKGHKRFFAKHVPYWIEKVDPAYRRDPVDLLAARWNLVNRQVASYKKSNRYLRITFEDLFSPDPFTSVYQLDRVREFCDLEPLEPEVSWEWINRPKNVSRGKETLSDPDTRRILQITALTRETFGYTNDIP